jgi:hypothetical protein
MTRIMSQRPHNICPDDYIKHLVAHFLGSTRSAPSLQPGSSSSFSPSPVHRNAHVPAVVLAFTSRNDRLRKTAKSVEPQQTSSEVARHQADSLSSWRPPMKSPSSETTLPPNSLTLPTLPVHRSGSKQPGPQPDSSSSLILPMNSPGPEATPPPEPSLSMRCSGSGAANQVDPSLFPSLPMQSSLPQLSADYENAILGILGAINSWLEAFDATQNRGAMSGLMRHLVKFYDASWFFTLLTLAIQLTQTCNAKLEACLNYGGRLTRMLLLSRICKDPPRNARKWRRFGT